MKTIIHSLRALAALALLLPATLAAQQAAEVVIRGRTVDEAGAPVPLAAVQLEGTTDGAVSGEDGSFSFRTGAAGSRLLLASRVGLGKAEQRVSLVPGDTLELLLVLRGEPVQLAELVVAVEGMGTGEREKVTIRPLEVVTTPGAAADIFRAFQTFPGVASVDEGAGLFVRGGEHEETTVLLDRATLVQPYKYESPTGGLFGIVPPYQVGETHFTTGGFGAQYGNALSGVLAMESPNLPPERTVTLGLGLAEANVAADLPLLEGKAGLRVSGTGSKTDWMFRLNGQEREFDRMPEEWNGSASLVYEYGSAGRLKALTFLHGDRLGVNVRQPSFDGVFHSTTEVRLYALHWEDHLAGWRLRGGLSSGGYVAETEFGVMAQRSTDEALKARIDLDRGLGGAATLRLGAEWERLGNALRGTVPTRAGIVDPEAEAIPVDESTTADRGGGYGEVEYRVLAPLVATLGARADRYSLSDEVVVDPRASLFYLVGDDTRLRLAWGIYHQFPPPRRFGEDQGNPGLRSMRAEHLIAGVHHDDALLSFRAEAYAKRFDHLLVEDPVRRYLNRGEGWAHGFDAFLKVSEIFLTPVNGWITYSYLNAERTQTRALGRTVAFERGPPPFATRHNLTVVGKAQLPFRTIAGVTYRHVTGRPVTPVVGGEATGRGYWLPVEGEVGSGRLPDYRRLDVQFSRMLAFGEQAETVFYLGVRNVLDRANVLDYDYTPDYSDRTERVSPYGRTWYFGASMTLK